MRKHGQQRTIGRKQESNELLKQRQRLASFFKANPNHREAVYEIFRENLDFELDFESWITSFTQYCEGLDTKELKKASSRKNAIGVPTALRSLFQSIQSVTQRRTFQSWLRPLSGVLGFGAPQSTHHPSAVITVNNEGAVGLEDLPDNVLGKILNLLDPSDVFKLCRVCKRWKNVLDRCKQNFRRAECTIASYLLANVIFGKGPADLHRQEIINRYKKFSSGLLNWYCSQPKNLEKLVCNCFCCYELSRLLKNCGSLKHLEIKRENGWLYGLKLEDSDSPLPVSLPKLETLIYDDFCSPSVANLASSILDSAPGLKALQYKLRPSGCKLQTRFSSTRINFSKLVALDITGYTIELLRELSGIKNCQLRLLRLVDFVDENTDDSPFQDSLTLRRYLSLILPKMKQLEILTIPREVGITRNLLRHITIQRMNLQYGIFYERAPLVVNGEEEYESLLERNEILDLETIKALRDMLILRDPSRDLSRIIFVLDGLFNRDISNFRSFGFTIKTWEELSTSKKQKDYSLQSRTIRQHLQLEY